MISKPFQNNGKMVPRRCHNGPEGSGTAGATMVYVAIFGAYARKSVFEKTWLLLDVSEKILQAKWPQRPWEQFMFSSKSHFTTIITSKTFIFRVWPYFRISFVIDRILCKWHTHSSHFSLLKKQHTCFLLEKQETWSTYEIWTSLSEQMGSKDAPKNVVLLSGHATASKTPGPGVCLYID